MQHQKPATTDDHSTPPQFVVQHAFDDVDELAEVTRAWDLDFRQLSRGGFRGSIVQAGTDGLQVVRTRLHGVLHQRGTAPAGLTTFAFSRPRHLNLSWRGHTIERDEMLIHGSDAELESTSQADFDMLVVSVSDEYLENACRRWGAPISGRLRQLEIAKCDEHELRKLRRWVVETLAKVVRNSSTMHEPDAARASAEHASDLIVRSVAPGLSRDHKHPVPRRRRLVEHAFHLARHHANEIHSVKDLCRETGASERTLRRGFNERFGVSPKSYLQAQRLIGVRREIRAKRNTLISDVANHWGFWHMGQFAADYRRQFGELPSETLRRHPGSP